jgi:tubulin polyglutamylase TTLL6/13
LIEINHTPSFATDTPLDYKIKFGLIKDTLKLMHITSKRKKVLFELAKESNQARLHNKKRLILDGVGREAKIAEEQKYRDDFENKHLGGYTKIYPLP